MLRFRGCQHFRQRLLLSTLSGKAMRIDDIRVNDQSPGLRDYEASLLRLLEKLTNGCLVEINETGGSCCWSYCCAVRLEQLEQPGWTATAGSPGPMGGLGGGVWECVLS
jgi:hypothetical protein